MRATCCLRPGSKCSSSTVLLWLLYACGRAQADALGLEGAELGQYVLQQQAIERDQRATEREEKRLLAEREERAAERDFQLAKLQAEKEIQLARSTGQGKVSTSSCENVRGPKLPTYQEGDDISNFLVRFERVAELLQIDKDSYAARLGCLLTGKATELYTSLSADITEDYALLKKALLTGFSKTADNYRLEFRQARIRVGENYQQFSVHLTRLFQAWSEASDVAHTFEGLKKFILLDQFLTNLSPDLRVFIKERRPTDLPDAVRLADDWSSARHAYPKAYSSSSRGTSKAASGVSPTSSQGDSSKSSVQSTPKKITCHQCGEDGHIRPRCPKNPAPSRIGKRSVPNYSVSGTINGSWSSNIIRDTGCSCVVVSEEVLPDVDVESCPKISLADYLGRVDKFPVVKCYVRCPFYTGWTEVVRAPIKFAGALIGNIPGVMDPQVSNPSPAPLPDSSRASLSSELQPEVSTSASTVSSADQVHAVTTRAGRMKRLHPLVLPELQPLSMTPQEFNQLQASCPSLTGVRQKASTGEVEKARNGSSFQYLYVNGLLYRKCLTSQLPNKVGQQCLVVPSECRQIILSVAHESPLAGHFSHRKTELKIYEHFFWPGMGADIRAYCRSCDKCQRMSSKGRVRPVPLQPLPVITEPFSRVAIDLVGPLSPPSSEGHRHILTLIDFATGFPEALPLKDIDSVSVAEALLVIFARVGIPREILSDRGTQFTSSLLSELHKLLGVKPIFTTPFHPSGNGRIERLHGPLKAALRKLCADKPREWHRYLVPTLFALREIPSDRTGFSPFELLYGRSVRGPLTVLKELWDNQDIQGEERTSFQYVLELRNKLSECAQLAAQAADVSTARYKSYFDLKSQDRKFNPGDEVLVLLPSHTSKLLVAWNGPYKVLERRGNVDYLIDEPRGPKLYHANLLKRYHRRAVVNRLHVLDEIQSLETSEPQDSTVPVVEEKLPDASSTELPITADEWLDSSPPSMPEINPSLPWEQRGDIEDLLLDYRDVFSTTPGCTSTIMHDIVLTTTNRIQARLYPVPIHLRPHFDEEVDSLLEQGIIQLSSSPHCSPVVMVRKSDGSYRMAIDYRKLNSVTVFHAEPSCNMEEDLHMFAGAKYFSEIDLCKAYYQIPLTDRAKPLTAFPTHRGLMEFCRLPFGLVTACATYVRLMRLVLAGLPNISFYFDNIFVHSSDWPQHISALRATLERLRSHNLTAKPSKCRFGVHSIHYLGFVLDGEQLRPQNSKMEALCRITPPLSKKALRSFLGMIAFYRMFIPQASDYTGPLSDLLKKGVREPLAWDETALSCFNHLKQVLSSTPVLQVPDCGSPFILRSDASSHGLGSVLLQYHQGVPHPVAYASRKLLDREKRYSTIERECLAVVFGVLRFDYYLRGREFILEVDHKPLLYLETFKGKNDRVLRWALSLQAYRFRVVHIAGKDNVGADLMSRLPA
ncbi:uncharacterized protein LOC123517739 [Portunus trituberculatus]|uniref:uncharacterized protein LOC123517739 n=1 Tax=Portunus trituberculatus TaxID=210409 RepID=UPI001E1CB9AD|nr:uncharacterized protein LOC123517739 [Portunus trituberculatus]